MEKINLSEPDGTRERWAVAAARESVRLGRAVSVSEFIRTAVEVYDESAGREQVEPGTVVAGCDDHGKDGAGVLRRSGRGRAAVGEPASRGALAGGAGGFVDDQPQLRDSRRAVLTRRPITKESQTRRAK